MASDTNTSEEVGVSLPIPRDNLYRAVHTDGVLELRDAAEQNDGIGLLTGHFSRFNEWTEIRSAWEGNFMERVAPGAFKKTMRENRDSIKVLYDHGHDPQIGNKVLGPLRDLREDDAGGYYEVPLLDTSYNRDLLPGLKAGLYGASFRFGVVREDVNEDPGPSEHNPRGLPERTIKEIRLHELGPVTFPAYAGATAGVRSLTSRYALRRFIENPEEFRRELVDLQQYLTGFLPAAQEEDGGQDDAPTTRAEQHAHPDTVRRAHSFLLDTNKREVGDTSWI